MSDKILKTLNGYTIYDEEARTRITSIEKDYASTDYVDEAVSQPVNALADGKVDKNQGTENNGKFLGVVDGYLVLVDAPSGTSGTTDVVRCVAQELTEEQQEQVRANIGAASMTEFSALSEEIVDLTVGKFIDYEINVKTISHRGYNTEAPENTIPAYVLARQRGYKYAECDVSFTSDGVAVLLHDSSIDRTSDGTGSISALTYSEVLQYDFGSWFSEKYTGTKIPTFEEFILLCRNIGLHPYIELKNNGGYTQETVNGLVDIVKSKGMTGKVTWISYSSTFLGYVKNADDSARLGYLVDTTSESKASEAVTTIQSLQGENNIVFADLALSYLNNNKLQYFIDADIPVEVYYISTDKTTVSEKILSANGYINGFTLDIGIAGKILYEEYMNYIPSEPDTPDNPEVTLTSINVTYTGGDVAVGTALTDLTGITVKATYSDGSNANVTGYTLSGTIAEGENTITVSYDGKTTTFKVTGIVESGGEEEPDIPDEPTTGSLVNSWDFTSGLTDSVGGAIASLHGSGITQDSNGVTISGRYSQLAMSNIINPNRRIEVDVAYMNDTTTNESGHDRFLMIGSGGSINEKGFIYRNTGSWQIYNGSWSSETVETDINAFDGKTVVLEIDNDMIMKAYCDDVLIATSPSTFDSGSGLVVGDSSTAYMTVTISAIRVYDIS